MAAGEGSRLRRGRSGIDAFRRRRVAAGRDGVHQALAQPGIGEAFGHGADALQRFGAFRRMGGDFGQRFVLQDPAAGNVARLRFALRARRRSPPAWREIACCWCAASAASRPVLGIERVERGVLQRRDFLGHPGRAAGRFELRRQPFIDHAQMGDVGQGIFQLALGRAGGGSSR